MSRGFRGWRFPRQPLRHLESSLMNVSGCLMRLCSSFFPRAMKRLQCGHCPSQQSKSCMMRGLVWQSQSHSSGSRTLLIENPFFLLHLLQFELLSHPCPAPSHTLPELRRYSYRTAGRSESYPARHRWVSRSSLDAWIYSGNQRDFECEHAVPVASSVNPFLHHILPNQFRKAKPATLKYLIYILVLI